MRTLLTWLVFTSLVVGRWWTMPKTGFTVGDRVRITVPTVDFPEYTDSQTVLHRGNWEVRIKDYVEWEPGEQVTVTGVWDGKGVVVGEGGVNSASSDLNGVDKLLVGVSRVRKWAVARLEQALPEPEASLAVGILLGVRRRMPPEFYQSLVNTGTVHVVAASGFNVMVVAGALMAVAIRLVGRTGGIGVGVAGIWLYVLLAGGSASVVRAGIMGTLTMIVYYWGRVAEARRLLWVAAGVMLLVNPLYIVDIGFQLSVAATWGLLYVGPWIELRMWPWAKEYLAPTLAASLSTAPIIWYHFGRLALISPLVNLLILPMVPLAMLLSAVTIIVPWIGYLAYVPLWWVVEVVGWWGR